MSIDNDLPTSRNHVRAAAFFVIVIAIALYFVDVELTNFLGSGEKSAPNSIHGQILKSILENMIAGAAVAFLLAIGYRWIVRLVEPGDRVIEVSRGHISSRLQENARSTSRYTFIGNTATFVTASILPILCSRARQTGQTIAGKLFVIDPRDDSVIEAYIGHKDRVRLARSRIADSDLASWTRPVLDVSTETPSEAKAKIYACIYLSAYAAKSSGISIDLYLRRSFTPFRADISDREVVLTQESPSESAVAFSSVGHFYGWYDKEAEAMEQQCTEVRLSTNAKLRAMVMAHPADPKEAVRESLRKLLSEVLAEHVFFADSEVEEAALKRIIRPTHSYEYA